MYTIAKRFSFEASHHLPHLPKGHKCARPHGHSYTAEFIFQAPAVDERGFVIDFAELNPIKTWIDHYFDHHDLNDVMHELTGIEFKTTSENLAAFLFNRFSGDFSDKQALVAVRISETESTWAEYRP